MKQYRIILITELNKPWNNGWYYQAGFEQNGHKVICFDPSLVTEPFKKIFEIVKSNKPHFIVQTKDELPAEILYEIKHFTKVIQWYPDPIILDWLTPYIKTADIFLRGCVGWSLELKLWHCACVGECRTLGRARQEPWPVLQRPRGLFGWSFGRLGQGLELMCQI